MDRAGIFAGENPFEIANNWLGKARDLEPNDPNAIALATVDDCGLPNVRMVLLKEIEQDAFVFYTNYDSKKGRELIASGQVAFVLHWKSLGRQIRVRGSVEKAEGSQADAYFDSRSPQSRVGAIASRQSQVIKDRSVLQGWYDNALSENGPTPKRPTFWGGFRIYPTEIEFWADGESRLHDRFRWIRKLRDSNWTIDRLSP
tara:strand:+ start:1432 stop:2034 length:603 start_codon:yes stop_codon:yes gene_type:complete